MMMMGACVINGFLYGMGAVVAVIALWVILTDCDTHPPAS
jgi:hypothetical protein